MNQLNLFIKPNEGRTLLEILPGHHCYAPGTRFYGIINHEIGAWRIFDLDGHERGLMHVNRCKEVIDEKHI